MKKKSRKAFTLLEIVIALALVGIVAFATISNLDGIFSSGQESVAKMFVNDSVKTPLMQYRINMGAYPSTEEGLNALMTAPATNASRWRGPYIEKLPEDPWGQPYHYRYPGVKNPASYDIWSSGPDRQDGTDDDIGNWSAPAKP